MDFTVVKLVDPLTLSPVIVTGGLVPRGPFDAGTTYAVGDSVDYLGSSYVMYSLAIAGTLPTDTTYWEVLANKGNTGSTGATGAQGDPGVVQSVVAGTNITVDNTDPANPIISGDAAGVTTVSVVTANGFSGSVSNPTTTPAITLTAGAITPTSVNSVVISGSSTPTLAVTGTTNVSGSNTGDQTNISGTAGNLSGTPALPNGTTATTQTQADNSTKLATTAYVDTAILGQNYKEACKYSSTGALPTVVYSSGAGTLTGFAVGAISLDGSSPVVNDRILIKNQVSTFQNGIYSVTSTGSGIAVFVLTRTTDANTSGEFKTGDLVFITAGSTLSTTTWAYTGIDSPNFTSDAMTYVQVAGQGSFTGGTGITITGTSIAIDTSVTVDKTTSQTLINKTLTSPVLTTPVLGTPSSGNLSGCTLAAADGATIGPATFITTDFTSSSGVISGMLRKVATASPSAVSSFTISSLSPGVRYKLIVNFVQNTSDGNPEIRFNSDSGSNYNYAHILYYASQAPANGTGAAYLPVSNNSVKASNFAYFIFDFNTIPSNDKYVIGTGLLYTSLNNAGGGTPAGAAFSGGYNGASNLTSITVLTNAGTMTGSAVLYALN